ncbi:MAG: hypothetical protein ACREVV_19745 [Steroidobacteraceae bacterium]
MRFMCNLIGALGAGISVLLLTVGRQDCAAAQSAPLILTSKIPLGAVHGRIDHLAVDLKRERLYVAELGNDSVAVVDLRGARRFKRSAGSRSRKASAMTGARIRCMSRTRGTVRSACSTERI